MQAMDARARSCKFLRCAFTLFVQLFLHPFQTSIEQARETLAGTSKTRATEDFRFHQLSRHLEQSETLFLYVFLSNSGAFSLLS